MEALKNNQFIKGAMSYVKTFQRDKTPEIKLENGSTEKLTHFRVPTHQKSHINKNFWKDRKPEVITIFELLQHIANPIDEALARSLQKTGQYRILQLSKQIGDQSLSAKNAYKFLSTIGMASKFGGKFIIKLVGSKWFKLDRKKLDKFIETYSYYTHNAGEFAQNATQAGQQALQMDVKRIDTVLNIEQSRVQSAGEQRSQERQIKREFGDLVQQFINSISRNAEKFQGS